MTETYNPILDRSKPSVLSVFGSRPSPEPGKALVLCREGHPAVVLWPGDSMTAGEARWGKYKDIITVDISEKSFRFKVSLPCKEDAFEFHAVIDVTCSVTDPTAIVNRNVTNVRDVLTPQILETMRRVSRYYEVEQSAQAEHKIAEAVRKESTTYDSGLTVNRFVVTLSLEDEARQHIRELKSIRRDHNRRLVQIELDKVREEKEAELQRQRDQFEMEQMQTKMGFYAPLIQGGQWQLLAMQLAQHPEDIESVARTLREQQRAEMTGQLEALRMLLEEDVIEAFQMEEASKRVLRRFVQSFGTQFDGDALTAEGGYNALTREEDTDTKRDDQAANSEVNAQESERLEEAG
jgi:hypothetical protein